LVFFAGLHRRFLFQRDVTGCQPQAGMGLLRCRRCETGGGKRPVVVIWKKISRPGDVSSQKWTLKMQLKIRRRAQAVRKNRPQMFQGLQQRISLHTDRRRLLAAEPGAKTIQLPTQFASQLIERFKDEGQPHFFSGSFE
jgi:hypothetical protein